MVDGDAECCRNRGPVVGEETFIIETAIKGYKI